MSTRVLLTGATGLVGSAITKHLVQHQFQVIALYRKNKQESLPHVKWIHCDMEKADERFFQSLPEVDVVIHNGAMVPLSGLPVDEEAMRKVNYGFSSDLFRWAFTRGVKKVLFTSTYSFLKKPLPEIITEESVVEPVGIYPSTKWEAESLLLSIPSEVTRAVALRIPSPVTPHLDHSPKNVVRLWIETARQGKDLSVMGTGSRTMDFVSVEDVAQAFVNAIDVNIAKNEVFNIGSGNTLSMKQLAEQIAETFGVGVTYQGTDANGSDRWNISIQKAQTILGYRPTFTSSSAIQALLENSRI